MKYEEKKLKLINFINNEIHIENLFYVLENKFRSYCIIIEKDKIIYASDKFNNVENKHLDTTLPTTITKRKYIKLNNSLDLEGNIFINNFKVDLKKYFVIFKYNKRYIDYEIMLAFFNKIKHYISNEL